MRTNRRHPHEGRMAEVYRKGEERLIWVGYTADPPPNAIWDETLQGWVLNDDAGT
jgi:hypothetical protein